MEAWNKEQAQLAQSGAPWCICCMEYGHQPSECSRREEVGWKDPKERPETKEVGEKNGHPCSVVPPREKRKKIPGRPQKQHKNEAEKYAVLETELGEAQEAIHKLEKCCQDQREDLVKNQRRAAMVEDRWRVTLREVQQLKDAQTELYQLKVELGTSEERHLLAVGKLREEHIDSLRVLGIMAGELEKDKASLGDEVRQVEAHNLALEERVSSLTKKLEEKNRQCRDIQESQDQAKEEYARALEDVQTRLAQKEAELRREAENHGSEAEQLRSQVEQESEGRRELEAQLEEVKFVLKKQEEKIFVLQELHQTTSAALLTEQKKMKSSCFERASA
ncbi:hypothetical protein AAFF_G00121560 [Aldrovandia affinis]|uniref:Uncharacterized protein n=1 Tax=Aldrovandia affinis TaxID=143900 RepID=A0AAD7W9W4_9TELE|nr:hypothetical protein AAFF_G00121560 [Aldrovandia affinis]